MPFGTATLDRSPVRGLDSVCLSATAQSSWLPASNEVIGERLDRGRNRIPPLPVRSRGSGVAWHVASRTPTASRSALPRDAVRRTPLTAPATRASPAYPESSGTAPRTPARARRCTRESEPLGAPSNSRPSRAEQHRKRSCGALRGSACLHRSSKSQTNSRAAIAPRALGRTAQSEQSTDEAPSSHSSITP